MLEINICDVFLLDDINSYIILCTVNFVVRTWKYQKMKEKGQWIQLLWKILIISSSISKEDQSDVRCDVGAHYRQSWRACWEIWGRPGLSLSTVTPTRRAGDDLTSWETQPVLLLPPPPGWREDGKITRTRYRNCVNFIYLRHMAHWWLAASLVVCEICMKQHQRCCWSLDRNVADTSRMVCISSQTVISAKVRPGSGDRPGH